jgi:hypothetical protein
MFEKLGWMAMAQKHNNQLKIKAYLEGINHLQECIAKKIGDTHDKDRVNDLKILHKNTECLMHCTHQLLTNTTQSEHNTKNNCIGENPHDATNCGLGKWMKHKFEKLGWMCLAMFHGNHSTKIQVYLDSIKSLLASLKKKLDEVDEKDRKDDIQILHDNVCVLQAAANKLLSPEGHQHHISHSKSGKRTKKSRHTV